MGDSSRNDSQQRDAELAERLRDDVIAREKGYLCAVDNAPLPKEDWGEMTCSYHRGPKS